MSSPVSLKKSHSFALNSFCSEFITLHTIGQLEEIVPYITSLPSYLVLGEGSNTIFCEDYQGCIIKPNFKGISCNETETHYCLSVASGENWHNFVVQCLKNSWFGLENLALIPGSVGAAPIQNIGAYGVELERFCSFVDWFDFATGKISRLTNSQCQFDYRHSIFKDELLNRGIITQVGFSLPKAWKPVIQYHGLNDLDEHCNAMDVFNRVVQLRTAKLPDPNLIPNAGSFFKNPIIDQTTFTLLIEKFPTLVYYPQKDNKFKLAAGWLIDHLKLKGFSIGNAMVHLQQALVLVNNGGATGKDIVNLAQHVQKSVAEFYGIIIEPEVRLIGANGEQKLHEFKYV